MSASWVSGGRITSRIVERHVAALLLHGEHEEAVTRAAGRCGRAWRHATETLGPSSGAGAVWAHLVDPCAEALGWSRGDVEERMLSGLRVRRAAARVGTARVLLVALPWGASQAGLQRAATRMGVESDARWVGVCNGMSWCWYDASRPFSREHLAIDLAQATLDARVWHVLWLLGCPVRDERRRRGGGAAVWIDRLASVSAADAAGSARALRDGVAASLSVLSARVPAAHDEHVTQIFQWLFVLFAEARALLPTWHAAYRRSYALSDLARDSCRPGEPAMGVHDSLTALARAGRGGISLGGVQVAALNGPLFAGSSLVRATKRIPDAVLGRLLHRLTHASGVSGDQPIDFGELGVEHLGALYEHLMAPPGPVGGPPLLRKRTGAFYTPRGLADVMVQRTLEPLVRDATAEQILALRVLDPAMGSGALLAAALRYLVGAVEAAWVREGRGGPLDVPWREREDLPRRIAEQCLYGVDVDARAVQVARLSIWLLSLAPDRPLTWLDAHLREGNSLVGASSALVLGRAPVRERAVRRRQGRQPTLFDLSQWHHEAIEVGGRLLALSARPTDSADDAHAKSRELAVLRDRGVLATWRARADAWCGASMDDGPVSPALWRGVDDVAREGAARTRSVQLDACRSRWTALARAQRCLHWALEFPDVFDAGRGGFDAVIANPPWEMLRGDLGTGEERASRRDDLGPLLRFVRRSGVYREAGGHINSYQLFVERMLQVVRAGGRVGCLLPGSVLADHGAAALRRYVFEHAAVDRLSIFDNREALFPIHRSMRVVCLTGTAGGTTDAVVVDDGVAIGVGASRRRGVPRLLPRALLRRASADAEAIPRVRDADDVRLLERVLESPRIGGDGWGLRFGRELNATEDRGLLRHGPGAAALAVVDGKHVQPFVVRPPLGGPWVRERDARRALPLLPWRRWRLAYRDVSSATNTRSLIAALLPPGCVSTHTLFCLRTRVGLETQAYLCGMFNSLVADWFVRRYLGAHVTTRLIAMVPVPRPPRSDPRYRDVVRLTLRLIRAPDGSDDVAAALQAVAADLYGLRAGDLEGIASDFPRLPPAVKARMLDRLRARCG